MELWPDGATVNHSSYPFRLENFQGVPTNSFRLLPSSFDGVREFWLVDPEGETIEVYALNGSEFVLASVATTTESLRSPLLPELSLVAKFDV